MIHYVAPAGEGLLPIRGALRAAGPVLARRVRPLTYERLARRITPEGRLGWRVIHRSFWLRWIVRQPWFPVRREALRAGAARLGHRYRALGTRTLPRGTYIFAAYDQLSPHDAEIAASAWQAIADAHPGIRLLNHPTRSLRRYELLRVLHERGINRFDVSRVSERRWPTRYPVFLREENAHGGWKSGLLQGRAELEQALQELDRAGRSRDSTLIVEFLDTADAHGIYRKYGAFRVGPRIIPRHVFFSRHWVLNTTDLQGPAFEREVREYVDTNPHEARLRELFELARIDYGRIDYAIRDDAIQVWEINSNPMMAGLAIDPGTFRGALTLEILGRLAEALRAVDADAG